MSDLSTKVKVNNLVLNFVLIITYAICLVVAINGVSKEWGYLGINYFMPSSLILVQLFFFIIIPIFFLPTRFNLASDYINIYLYLFTYIPSVIVPYFINDPKSFKYDYSGYLIVQLFCFIILFKFQRNYSLLLQIFKRKSTFFIKWFFILFYLICTLIFLATFGLNFRLPSISEVYDVRMEFREAVQGNVLSGYLIGWMGYIVNIFVFLFGLYSKNRKLVIFAIIYQFYLFSILALKSHLATMLLAYILYLVFSKLKKFEVKHFISFTALLFVVISILDWLFDTNVLHNVITRRIMIIPSQLVYYHYEFFSEHEKTFWGYSAFKFLFNYPYHYPPPNLIGELYFNKPEMTAVVNFISEGYTALGYIGMIIVTLLFRFILNIIDTIYKYRSNKNLIIIIMFLCLANAINSSGIFVLLLTHGLLFFVFLLLIFDWNKLDFIEKNR